MTELLKQALILTGWGMGMTFLSIGALVVGMYLMTTLIRDKKNVNLASALEFDEKTEESPNNIDHFTEENEDRKQINDDKYLAAAAAVAVALAVPRESETHHGNSSEIYTASAAWDHYTRGRHVSQRSRFEQLRFRH